MLAKIAKTGARNAKTINYCPLFPKFVLGVLGEHPVRRVPE
jgi:hypothetical protein